MEGGRAFPSVRPSAPLLDIHGTARPLMDLLCYGQCTGPENNARMWLVMFLPAVAYHFYLSFTETFSQPRKSNIFGPSTHRQTWGGGRKGGRKEGGKRRNKVNEKIRAVLILTQKAILLTWVIPAAFLEVMKREFKVIYLCFISGLHSTRKRICTPQIQNTAADRRTCTCARSIESGRARAGAGGPRPQGIL